MVFHCLRHSVSSMRGLIASLLCFGSLLCTFCLFARDRRPLLKEIKDSSELQIILDCETDHILDILQQAQEVNLVDEYHSYILTSLVSNYY